MSFFREPHQEWKSWVQRVQKRVQINLHLTPRDLLLAFKHLRYALWAMRFALCALRFSVYWLWLDLSGSQT